MKIKKISKFLSIILIFNILLTPIQLKSDKVFWTIFGLSVIQLFNSLSQHTSSILTKMNVDRLSTNTIVNSTCSTNPAVSNHSFTDLYHTSNATYNSSLVGMGICFLSLCILWVKLMQKLKDEQRDLVATLAPREREMQERSERRSPQRSTDRKDGYVPPAYVPSGN